MKNVLVLLFLLAGDIEFNPGPRSIPEFESLFSCKDLKCFHQNVCGLQTNFELIMEFLTEWKNTDILTHTQPTDKFEIFNIPGVHLCR